MVTLLFALLALIMPMSNTEMPTASFLAQQVVAVDLVSSDLQDTLVKWSERVAANTSQVAVSTATTETAIQIEPKVASVNLRSRPSTESRVLGVVQAGERLQTVESNAAVLDKLGTYGQWVTVQMPDGSTAYTAAWLFTQHDAAPAAVAAAATTTDRAPLGVYIAPVGDRIRIRQTPTTQGAIVGLVNQGEVVEVLEQDTAVVDQIGKQGQWVRVRTEDGTEGYTAAWLYAIHTGVLPAWVDAAATTTVAAAPTDRALIPPLSSGTDLLTDTLNAVVNVPVVDSLPTAASAPTPIPLLGESLLQGSIPPLADSIGDLNITAARPAVQTVATVGHVDTTAATTDPLNEVTDLSAQLTSDVVPITIAVADDVQPARAELGINGHKLATFTEPPYSYALDTTRLSEGDYKLTFTVVSTEGVASIGDLDFAVATVKRLPNLGGLAAGEVNLAALDSTLVANDETSAAPLNFLLLNGERRNFDLMFTLDAGLQPVPLEDALTVIPEEETLIDILSQPAHLIPAPVMNFLTAQHPVFSSIVVLLMTVILLPQGFFTLYWMTYTWNDPEAAEKYSSPKEYAAPEYSFTAVLPARHEEDVIKETIKAIDRIDYPDHLKEILVMIRDEDDDGTIAQTREAIQELGKDNIRLITFTDGPYNKPNGLNRALKAATNQVVCIFDAEDDPHPEIYNVVNTVMLRDDADVVQSGVQLINFESNWFSALNCLEYFFWFKSGLHAFTHQFNVTPLGGNTVFFKKHWLERVGGWDEGCLTEDGDIGIRLTQLGAKIQIVYDAKHATQEETPHNVDSFIKQRTRWMQGFYQIFLKGDWRQLPQLKQKITALYILLNSLLQASIVFFIPVGLYIALTQQIPVPLALFSYLPIFLLLVQLVINLVGIREFTEAYNKKLPFLFTLKMILAYYPFQLMLSLSAMRAIWRMLKQNASWEKTAHSNLHRQPEAVLAREGA